MVTSKILRSIHCWSLVLVFVFLCALPAAGQTNTSTNAVESTAVKSANATVVVPPVVIKEPDQIWLTFGLNRVPALQLRPIGGIPLWQLLASLIYIILAFYVSKLLDYIVSEKLQKWAAKTQTRFDDIAIQLLRGPVKIVSFVILVHVGMRVYSWPEGLAIYMSIVLKIVVALSITYVLLKAVDALMGVWRERTTTAENEQFSRLLLPLIGKIIKVFVVILVVLFTSQNLGFNVTSLIAGVSIGGLAIGLAAQDTLANLFGAIAVLLDKPFKVGDRIQVDGVDGHVESIGFRSTRIRNLDGFVVSVPNKTLGNSTINNVTLRPTLKTVMNIGLTYDTPPGKVVRATRIIEEIYRGKPATTDLVVAFDKFTDFTLNILVVHWWKGGEYKNYLADMQDANLVIMKRFAEERIEFAFPTRTVYVKQDQGVASSAKENRPTQT
jgi:MscS family membrane protein